MSSTKTATPAELAAQLTTLAMRLTEALQDETTPMSDRVAALDEMGLAAQWLAEGLRAVSTTALDTANTSGVTAWKAVSDAADNAGRLVLTGAHAVSDVIEAAEDALKAR